MKRSHNFVDLVGQRFNRLVVLSQSPTRKQWRTRWTCKCDCGKITTAETSQLKSGNTKSCGCLKLETTSKIFFKDITNQKFNRLTALKIFDNIKGKIRWDCVCECGNHKAVTHYHLTSGLVKSCGCLHKEVAKNRFFKNLTGKKFGRLTVMRELKGVKKHQGTDAFWECQCDCGKITETSTHHLNSGNTKSCGCYTFDLSRMMFQQPKFQQHAQMRRQMKWMEIRGELVIS